MSLIHADGLDWAEIDDGKMSVRRKQLGEAADGEKLGCSLYELPPGEESWPYHYHTANEEALYVLSGSGTLRLAETTYSISEDTYVALPAEEAGGHKVFNDTDEPLRYLMFSTMTDPDVTVYPDSDKIGVYVGSPPGGRGERSIHGYYAIDDTVDYWADE